MTTRANQDTDPDTSTNPLKKTKLSNAEPDFTKVLLECGVASLGSNDMAKTGSSLDQDVTPSSLRASIHGLLSEKAQYWVYLLRVVLANLRITMLCLL